MTCEAAATTHYTLTTKRRASSRLCGATDTDTVKWLHFQSRRRVSLQQQTSQFLLCCALHAVKYLHIPLHTITCDDTCALHTPVLMPTIYQSNVLLPHRWPCVTLRWYTGWLSHRHQFTSVQLVHDHPQTDPPGVCVLSVVLSLAWKWHQAELVGPETDV